MAGDLPEGPEIAVVGSANLDLVVEVATIPVPGETVLGGDLRRIPGGKGANQAVAAARLGRRVAMVGRVGDDDAGTTLRSAMDAAGVDTTWLLNTDNTPSGTALIAVAADGDKSMFLFDEPRDVKGTAFLIHGHKASDDDQWLYLPALRRVKRISSANRSGSFMGSEFAYEDMSAQEVEKYTYRYLRDEPCAQAAGANAPLAEGLACAVYERFPTDAKSGYSRQEVWQDRDAARLWKVAYYDRKGDHLKTLTFGSYQQYLDQHWHAHEMEMVNHLTGKGTVLSWSDYQFRTDLDDGDFTQTGLRRIR